MTGRIVVAALVCVLALTPLSISAQQPTLLGRIPSDTMGVLFGREIITLGDQNGDGRSDIVIADNRFSLHLFHGSFPVDTLSRLTIYNASLPFNVGDVNADSYDDLWFTDRISEAFVNAICFGGPTMDTIRNLRFGDGTRNGTKPVVRTADINDNGTDEIICRADDGWSVLLYETADSPDSLVDMVITPANKQYWEGQFADGLISGDFNGDGYPDIAANYRPRPNAGLSGEIYFYWGGPDFDTIPDLIVRHPREFQAGWDGFGKLLVNLGDFNGDGWDDIYTCIGNNTDDTLAYMYWGGPGIDTIPDMIIAGMRGRAASAGDINNDGYPDLITSLPTQWSGIGWVYVYYGGPDADSLPDFELYINELPGYKTQFGMDVAGIGDFNGDGVDDFAFSCVHAGSVGTVYFYAGFDGSTSTGGGGGGGVVLPVDFELFQNYPNPFNPSTTISFSLPEKTYVTLTIHNVLGQRVKSLLSSEFSAGTHSVVWDGTDEAAQPVASGVYVYRVMADEVVLSRKMVLAR